MFSTIFMLLVNAGVPNPVQTAQLVKEVAEAEQVDPVIIAKLIIVESRGRPDAINRVTGDYGIAQVNLKAHPEHSVKCLLNAKCGLVAGVRIFKKAKRPCAYNLGNAGATRYPIACAHYEAKFAAL